MELKLENLPYQQTAIQSVVRVFEGTTRNTFDNACFLGIRANICKLTPEQLRKNIEAIVVENGIDTESASLTTDNDVCIEMETGTGKTLVYVRTIYELYKNFGFTKFIILVPSIPIRQGVLSTFEAFGRQLENIYGFIPHCFEYESRRLNKVITFIEEQHPQVMVMTLASFNSSDKILQQTQREYLFADIPFIQAIGKTNPVIIMDEPQEGMDTANAVSQLAKFNPLFKLRYSATHKIVKNLLYRLTPYDSYNQGLVKKIEVLTVTEKNDEATIKIELAEIQTGKGEPKVKLKAWHRLKNDSDAEFKKTKWLEVGDDLEEKTNNAAYSLYKIERIYKDLQTGKWRLTFSDGTQVFEKQAAGNVEQVWALQLEWLVHRHFSKMKKLAPKGIKCLSLIFIDKVANYMGQTPIIKNLFIEKFKTIYPAYNNGNIATDKIIEDVQGYYFAKKASGDYTDGEGGLKEQTQIYEAILRDKDELINYGESKANKIQFIFSHSALGVGWDNPNVFNIATLNTAYSDIRKRQEIGRGLRICVDKKGQRIYDAADAEEVERINQLTIIPNETYESFVTQYQEEIKAIYGNVKACAEIRHTYKGEPKDAVMFNLNNSKTVNDSFRRFWKLLQRKPAYNIVLDEEILIEKSIAKLNEIIIDEHIIEASGHFIKTINEAGKQDKVTSIENIKQKVTYHGADVIEEISKRTSLSSAAVLKIAGKLNNYNELIKSPSRYIHKAAAIIHTIEMEEMLRGASFRFTGEKHTDEKGKTEVEELFHDHIQRVDKNRIVGTPSKGVFDKMVASSEAERQLIAAAESDPKVICFFRFPSWYKIETPIGEYSPEFGLVMKWRDTNSKIESDHYFVVETRGSDDSDDKKRLKESGEYKLIFARQHFRFLGIEYNFKNELDFAQF